MKRAPDQYTKPWHRMGGEEFAANCAGALWRPHLDFIGPCEPPMVRVLRAEGVAALRATAPYSNEIEKPDEVTPCR